MRERTALWRASGIVAAIVLAITAVMLVDRPWSDDDHQARAQVIGGAQVIPNRSIYGPGEIVYVDGAINYVTTCSNPHAVKDYFQPFANLYLVSSPPNVGDYLTDVSGAPNTVFGSIAGGFVQQIIGITQPGGNLPAGTYGIVVDECQDEYFTNEDTFIPDAFTVRYPSQMPSLAEAGTASFRTMKASARDTATATEHAALAWKALLELAQIQDTIQKFNVFDPAGVAIGWAGWAINEGIKLIPGYVDPKAGATAAIVSTHQYWKGIAADPPDPDFRRPNVALPAQPLVPLESTSDKQVLIDAGEAMAIEAAVAEAMLHAMERYQGAVQVGADDWALVHLRSLARLAELAADRVTASADALDAIGSEMVESPSTPYNNISQNHWYWLAAMRDKATVDDASGFPTAGRDALRNLGLTDAEWPLVQQLTAAHTYPRPQLPQLLAEIGGIAAERRALSTDLTTYAAEIATSATALEAVPSVDPAWVQADAGGPYAAAPGSPVALDATGSTGTPVAYSWDLNGDGVFGDVTGPNPTTAAFTAPSSTYLVAVEVTDDAGRVDVDHAIVTTSAGSPPDATVVSPDPKERELTVGVSQTYELATTGSVEWFLDGTPIATGPSWVFTPTAGDQGGHEITALVAGPGGQRWVDFFATVGGTDGDGDGWLADPGPDCNDADPAVHPYRAEVIGNGIDDDCDPATSDSGEAPGIVANPTMNTAVTISPWFVASQEGDRLNGTWTWNHPARLSGQPFDYTLDFGDGTPPVAGTVAGTTADATNIVFDHVVAEHGQLLIELCITAPGAHTTCEQSQYTSLPSEPIVTPANLDGWTSVWIGEGVADAGAGPIWKRTTGSATIYQEQNQSYPALYVSDFTLADGDRIAVDAVVEAGPDDDGLGIAFGIPAGSPAEAVAALQDPTSDWISVEWDSGQRGAAIQGCLDANRADGQVYDRGVFAQRTRGLGMLWEHQNHGTAAYTVNPVPTPAPPPRCLDGLGVEVLQHAQVPLEITNAGVAGAWSQRALPAQVTTNRRPTFHHIVAEYSTTRLQVWIDGHPTIDVAAAPGQPFPLGRVALFSQSQGATRFQAHAPTPSFAVTEGDRTTFTTPVEDVGINDELVGTFAWNDESGAAVATLTPTGVGTWNASADHAFADDGNYVVDVCIDDLTDDVTGCGELLVDVANATPVVDAGPDLARGRTVDLAASFTDAGVADTHTATIDWGDGSSEPAALQQGPGFGAITGSHTYAADGTYPVEICVTDDDGATGCDTAQFEVLVSNATPVALAEAASGDEGSTIEVGAGVADDNIDDVHTVTIDWGDGSAPESVVIQQGAGFGSGPASHTYRNDASYDVDVEVCDDRGACSSTTRTVEIANVAPSLTLDPITDPTDGTGRLTGSYSDPGVDDTHTVEVAWGDGDTTTEPVSGGSFALDHGYTADGGYMIDVCVIDDDDARDCRRLTVQVSGAATSSSTSTSVATSSTTSVPDDSSTSTTTTTIADSGSTSTTIGDTGSATTSTTAGNPSTTIDLGAPGATTTLPTPTPVDPGGELPSTGSSPWTSTPWVLLVLGAGALLVAVSRRRRPGAS